MKSKQDSAVEGCAIGSSSSYFREWLCNRFFVGAGPSTSDDALENTLLVTLATGQQVCALAAQFNDKLVGSRNSFQMGYWMEVGGNYGCLQPSNHHQKETHTQHSRARKCREVKFPSQRHARDILLKPDRYVGKDSTGVSS